MTLRIGMLTPSSNTVLEPVTTAMLAGLDDVSVHFSRFRVVAIGLDRTLLGQFDDRPMLAAAELLADAKVDVIVWNGTSAGWLGLDADRRLCVAITRATGIRAVTSVLALHNILARRGERRIGLVTPYTDDVQARVIAGFAREGIEVVSERHLGILDNFSFGQVPETTIAAMVEETAHARPDAVAIFCTNLAGGLIAPRLEEKLGLAVHDSVAAALYGALANGSRRLSDLARFGQMFTDAASATPCPQPSAFC